MSPTCMLFFSFVNVCIQLSINSTECGHSFCCQCLATNLEFILEAKFEHIRILWPRLTRFIRVPKSSQELQALASILRANYVNPNNIFSYPCPTCRFTLTTSPLQSPQHCSFIVHMCLLLGIQSSKEDLELQTSSTLRNLFLVWSADSTYLSKMTKTTWGCWIGQPPVNTTRFSTDT